MILAAGLGVAMGNARKRLRSWPIWLRRRTTKTVWQDHQRIRVGLIVPTSAAAGCTTLPCGSSIMPTIRRNVMSIVGWILIIALFAVGMAGAVVPVLPGVVAIYAAFFSYTVCSSALLRLDSGSGLSRLRLRRSLLQLIISQARWESRNSGAPAHPSSEARSGLSSGLSSSRSSV